MRLAVLTQYRSVTVHGQTNGRTELLYQYRPLHLCLNAESYIKKFMHFRDRGCVHTLRPLFVYVTADTFTVKQLDTSQSHVIHTSLY